MDIYAHISEMKPLIAARDWDGLESAYHSLAAELAGRTQARRIAHLAFAAYQARLQPYIAQARSAAAACQAKAIYFEYDLDNGWQSSFFICEKYNPEASAVYLENHFDGMPHAKGSTLYLVARTVAAFGRCLAQPHANPNEDCRNTANPLLGIACVHRRLLSALERFLDRCTERQLSSRDPFGVEMHALRYSRSHQ